MKKTSQAVLISVLLAGCAPAMPSLPMHPESATPQTWRDGSTAQVATQDHLWWNAFGSDELTDMVTAALAHNPDLAAGIHRIEQSRTAARAAGASLLPTVDGSGGANWRMNDPAQGATTHSDGANAGISVSYELDLFGRNRAGVDAAQSRLRASQHDQDALRIVVAGDVARGYFTLVNLRERRDVIDKNVKNSREVLQIVTARFDAGTASGLDVARQKTSLAQAESTLEALSRDIAAAENALSILLGRAPQDIATHIKSLRDMTVPAINLSAPVTVLAARPDIRAAEEALIAADADIVAARAAFFPSVNLGAALSASVSPLGDPVSKILSATSALSVPIFRGGALTAGMERSVARRLELTENYRGTILNALAEVENARVALDAARKREELLAQAAAEAEKAYTMSRNLFEAGATDYQTMLEAETTRLNAGDNHVAARLETLLAVVNMHKALGDGRAGAEVEK